MLLTDIDGLYTADPRHDPDARLVAEVTDFETLEGVEVGHTHLAAGLRRDALEGGRRRHGDRRRHSRGHLQRGARGRAAGGARRATRRARTFPRAQRATPPSSCGCATPSPATGRCVVDAGAARALREEGTSLLPVGIVEVLGAFDAGDAVEIAERGTARERDGRRLGEGHLQLLGR